MLAAFITTVLFSLSAVCANRTAKLLGGITANFWRLVLAGVFLGIWAHGFRQGVAGAAFPLFLLSGCIGFGVGDLALFEALPRLGSRLTVLLVQCLAAPLAALTEWLWLGTTLSPLQILCGLAILAGVGLALSGDPASTCATDASARRGGFGMLFGLIAALGQGLGAVLSRKAYAVASQAGQDIDGITAAYQRVLGGLIVGGFFLGLANMRRGRLAPSVGLPSTPAASPERPLGPFPKHNTIQTRRNGDGNNHAWRRAWLWVLLNALAGPTLGVSFYQWALKTTPTGLVLTIVATTPLFVIPFAVLLEGDRPGVLALIGGVLAVAGAIALTLVS